MTPANSSILTRDCAEVATVCARFEGQIQALNDELATAQKRLADATEDVDELTQTLAVLQRLEAAWKKTFEETLANVVSRGLSLVFGETMTVEIVSDVQRGASAVEFQLTTSGLTTPIVGARGGSVVEVAAFLLRILLILSSRPPLRRVVIIDESFRMVADENLPALAQLIRQLADRLQIQVLLVTHMPAFADAADAVYEVTKMPGEVPTARVRRIKDRQEALT